MIRDDQRVVRRETRDGSASLQLSGRSIRLAYRLAWLKNFRVSAYPTWRWPTIIFQITGIPIFLSLSESGTEQEALRELASGL
jgi:hypothetical protein